MSMLYQDKLVRDKWLKNYVDEINSNKEHRQIDVIKISFLKIYFLNRKQIN